MKTLKVAQFGLGPIGIEAVKLAARKPWIEMVGGVDVDPSKVGRTLADLTGVTSLGKARVYQTFEALYEAVRPDVVLHTAGSKASGSLEQMEPMIERGLAIASTCEELAFPALSAPALAAEADKRCQRTGARIVGTGVNPGFVMDLLPVCLTAVCREVKRVKVQRVVDASTRRQPLQAKIGSGSDPKEFAEKLNSGRAGHAGLRESVALLAHSLGWALDGIEAVGEPVVAERKIETRFFTVEAGQTCGIHQTAVGRVGGDARITLDLWMYLGAPRPRDVVEIEGEPELGVRVEGGVPGDGATVAALVNAIPRLVESRPGLHLPTDLAVPRWA